MYLKNIYFYVFDFSKKVFYPQNIYKLLKSHVNNKLFLCNKNK